MHPVAVYFSPKSRDYTQDEFLASYRGAMVALLQAHREVQVVTPRTLKDFRGAALVLPEVTVLSDGEKQGLKSFVENGGRLVVLGTNASGITSAKVTTLSSDPAREYFHALEKDFAGATKEVPKEFLEAVGTNDGIEVEAPPTVAANFGVVNGTPHIFMANFTGLVPSKVAVPTALNQIRVRIPSGQGKVLTFVPFLGGAQVIQGQKQGDKVEFVLPTIDRGAVVWIGGNP